MCVRVCAYLRLYPCVCGCVGGGGSAFLQDLCLFNLFGPPLKAYSSGLPPPLLLPSLQVVSDETLQSIEKSAAVHAQGNKTLAAIFAHTVAAGKPVHSTPSAHSLSLAFPPDASAALPARVQQRLVAPTAVEWRVLQWVGRQFGFWEASEPPLDAPEEAVSVAAAIVRGWMRGLATPMRYSEDALSQVAVDFSRACYKAKLARLRVSAMQENEEV